MLLRRRCNAFDVLTYFLVSACAVIFLLICTIVYGTRTESPQLPSLVKEFLPAGRCQCEYSTTFTCDTCLDCAAGQSPLSLTSNTTTITPGPGKGNKEKEWSWEYKSDAQNYGLDDGQCQAAFPGLFEDVERARKYRRGKKVAERELSGFQLSKGMVRAMIFGGELYILQTHLVDNTNREKAIATLHSMHRALVSSPSSPPNIEFIFSVEDLPAQPNSPLWVLARRAQDHNLWLIPDFGFWSWDVPQIGTYSEVAAEAVERESWESWNDKQEKLVWRGKVTMAPKLRHALLDAARGKSWSDVGQVRWGTKDFKEAFLGPVDQCGWRFIAHAEGRSYSGALKYRQLCRSVVIAHKLQWIQHHHYLMSSSGPNQNFVEVERDFSNLDEAMQDLLKHPEKAKRIADNSVKVFRERYLTPAAEACYWRRLWKGWRGVQGWEPSLYLDAEEGGKGTMGYKKGRRVKRGVRFETFMLFETGRQMTYPDSASA